MGDLASSVCSVKLLWVDSINERTMLNVSGGRSWTDCGASSPIRSLRKALTCSSLLPESSFRITLQGRIYWRFSSPRCGVAHTYSPSLPARMFVFRDLRTPKRCHSFSRCCISILLAQTLHRQTISGVSGRPLEMVVAKSIPHVC